ncbi:MAG: ABC transporter ATP-binding protein, partial [Nocardioidaceae bacterium]
AIKMGDRIAILKEGGRLAQFAAPKDLLERPVDEFVAGFVGRDRGYRGLSFTTAADLPIEPVAASVEGLRLTLDDGGRPSGWTSDSGATLPIEGTYTAADTLRTVMDLTILSPAGTAVRVDASGRADGLVRHSAVASYVRERQLERLGARER